MSARIGQTKDNAEALDDFISAKFEIDVILERFKGFSEDHFGIGPDEIHCGHVGTLTHHVSLLRQITDSAVKDGEHAK